MPHFEGSQQDKIGFYRNFFSGLKTLRSNFEDIWTDIDLFVFGFTGSYDSNPIKGQVTYENVYDTTAVDANIDATNALVGILWQSGGRSIRITPAEGIKKSKENLDWFEKATKKFVTVLDDPNARLVSSLAEYMGDALGRGSSGVGTYRGCKAPLLFKSHAIRYLYYQDNDEGIVDTVALRTWMPAYMAVEKYGIENVAEKVRENNDSATQRNTEVEIITFIFPNTGADMKEKPFHSVHVDFSNDWIMKESFFLEMPIKVGRIFKNPFETYGRGPAINSLANIKRINSVTGDLLENIEKIGSPPLAILGDGVLGQGVINLSAGSVNQLNTQAADGMPIQPVNTVGDLQPSIFMVERLQQAIISSYQLDKLSPLMENQSDTATEALLIDRIRNTSVGGMLARQINELFTPLIETSFNTLFIDGLFGFIEGSDAMNEFVIEAQLKGTVPEFDVIPKDIAEAFDKGDDIYIVEYLTPAARMLKSEEAANITQAFNQTMQFAQADPNVLDNVNLDEATQNVWKLNGIGDMLNDDEAIEQIRKAKAEIQAQQLEQQQAQQEVETAKTASEIQQ